MIKTFDSITTVLTTSEADIYTAPSDSKAMTLLVQAVNNTGSAANCEIWLTDDSNAHKALLFPSQSIEAYKGISDTAKHIIKSNYKIRGFASAGTAIYVEISVLEGM